MTREAAAELLAALNGQLSQAEIEMEAPKFIGHHEGKDTERIVGGALGDAALA